MLTTGGIRTWAICTDCDDRGGRSLRSEWIVLAGWVLAPILLLVAAAVVYYVTTHP